ncbi:hypothetical protein Nhal_0139 [Nitrosococcus halophilus Nc 4]|uniref:Uncharacterized protein n=1 Tax=Nitrosococcus halophilus (strain Nc4) TaxID=472759 RepID=D5C4T3_NITHN|nr:hypothetical protein [Nitrosococcus halophilus]ADE13356.1 hypothetical protein Nhal_0139 [Nitrosococcus halophilus Nc 4]
MGIKKWFLIICATSAGALLSNKLLAQQLTFPGGNKSPSSETATVILMCNINYIGRFGRFGSPNHSLCNSSGSDSSSCSSDSSESSSGESEEEDSMTLEMSSNIPIGIRDGLLSRFGNSAACADFKSGMSTMLDSLDPTCNISSSPNNLIYSCDFDFKL